MATQKENAQQVWNYLRAKGWSKEATAGVLGNMQQESGIMPDMDEYGSGVGYGLVQWTSVNQVPGRQYVQQKMNAAGINGDYRSISAQLELLVWDMHHGQYIAKASYPYSPAQFIKLNNVATATVAFEANFERPAVTHPERIGMAQQWFNLFSNEATHNGIAIDNVTNSVADITVKWLKERYAPLLTLHMVRADLQPNNVYTVVVDCYSFSTLQYALNRAAADLRITEPGYIQSNMVHNQNSDGSYRIEIRNCNPQMAKRVVPLLSKNLSTDTYANILGKTIVKSPTSYGSFDIRIKGEGFNNHDTPIVVGEIQSYLYILAKLTGDHVKSFKY
ncbi:phage tail tip lysozyme [Vagococcus entomophilus]|uniref:Phage tail lysozyme domain-containing protein n=1 Tax=Vagococcus entomophilus TaxID=1160095 RepID=A0A430AHA9_9ENTE|nr:phage tail tip lysozyme [Vagococcus entomophilus]RSU07263.1 hypothetical protein CBF30_08390 [Vagococcus entomophilus]